jgi:hypothetical protein
MLEVPRRLVPSSGPDDQEAAVDADELRRVQAPLKEHYREAPAAAMITLAGGDGSLACSGDMLLQALVACAGVTLRSVATSRGYCVVFQTLARTPKLSVASA